MQLALVAIVLLLCCSIAFKAVVTKRFKHASLRRSRLLRAFGYTKAPTKAGTYVLSGLYIFGSLLLMVAIGFLYFLLHSPLVG